MYNDSSCGHVVCQIDKEIDIAAFDFFCIANMFARHYRVYIFKNIDFST